MSQCSDKILVIEAGANCGVLNTVKYAIALEKEVYAVPNSIYNPESKGTNELIVKGAKIYLSPHQICPNIKIVSAPQQST